MRRTVVLVAIWIVAAIGAVTVAWQGVGVVGNQVTDDRPAALAASEIEARLADGPTTTTANDSAATSSSSTSSTSAPVVPGPSPTSQPGPAPTAAPATPTTAAPAAGTRTYNLQGGTASLRFSASGVTVVFANPATGFAVSVEPEHGNGVSVEFESATHESRVDGWWEDGPVDRVREEADD